MSNDLFATNPPTTRRYPAALLAGFIGGLISGLLKLGWEVPWPPRAVGRIPEPQVLVSLFTHHPTPSWVSLVIHFTFSIFMGAAYGLLAEIFPIVTLGLGVAFGLAIQIGAHEIIMPLIGLTPAAWLLPVSEQGSELFGHILWGFTIGVFYEDLRRRLTAPRSSIVSTGRLLSARVHALQTPLRRTSSCFEGAHVCTETFALLVCSVE